MVPAPLCNGSDADVSAARNPGTIVGGNPQSQSRHRNPPVVDDDLRPVCLNYFLAVVCVIPVESHRNPNLFRNSFLGKIAPVSGAFVTAKNSL